MPPAPRLAARDLSPACIWATFLHASTAAFAIIATSACLLAVLAPMFGPADWDNRDTHQDALMLEIMRAPSSSSACQNFSLDLASPLQPLQSLLCAVNLRANITKVLNSEPGGAPADALALGIRVGDPEGRGCWLISSASPSPFAMQKSSALMGDYFMCGKIMDIEELPGSPANAGVVMGIDDFFPALSLAVRAGRISENLLSLSIDCIFPFSETSICSEDTIVIRASLNSSARFELSSISVDGEEVAFAGNYACIVPSNGPHNVTIAGASYASFFPARIEQTFYDLHF